MAEINKLIQVKKAKGHSIFRFKRIMLKQDIFRQTKAYWLPWFRLTSLPLYFACRKISGITLTN